MRPEVTTSISAPYATAAYWQFFFIGVGSFSSTTVRERDGITFFCSAIPSGYLNSTSDETSATESGFTNFEYA